MTDHVVIQHEDATRIITMRRPDKKNALTQDMYAAISKAIDSAQDDAAIIRIIGVLMAAPIAKARINLHVANLRRAVAELDDGAFEIRSGFVIPKAGMQDADGFAVQ